MEQNTQNILLVEKMAELIKKAPHDWAERIAEKMGKGAGSVYLYSKCERGMRRGYPLEVLKQLTEMVKEQEKEIKKLTA
jgi:imidazole glycerol phosphate synthase subunit HisF